MAGSAMAGYKRLQGEGYMLIKASETCRWLLALFRLKGMSGDVDTNPASGITSLNKWEGYIRKDIWCKIHPSPVVSK